MPTSRSSIEKMYDQLYKSKYDSLVKERDSALSKLKTRDKSISNQFNDTKKQLDLSKSQLYAKYKSLYEGLDTQASEGKENYYNQRNDASYSNAKNTQAIRDYMAKNNLLQSGESVDALLRNNTDFSNTMGDIKGNEQKFNTNLNNTRKNYQTEELNNVTSIENSLASALKERDRMIAELQAQRDDIGNSFNSGVSSMKSEIEYQKLKDIMAYEDALAAAAASAAAAAARSYSYGSGSSSRSSSGGSGTNYTSAPTQATTTAQINELLNNGQLAKVRDLLESGALKKAYSDTYEKKVREMYNSHGGAMFNTTFDPKVTYFQRSKAIY